jgi:hypothetical protein
MPPGINVPAPVRHRHLLICNIIQPDRPVTRGRNQRRDRALPRGRRPQTGRHRRTSPPSDRRPQQPERRARLAHRWICPGPRRPGVRHRRHPRPGHPVRRPWTSTGRAPPHPFRPRRPRRPDHRRWISGRRPRSRINHREVRRRWISVPRRRRRAGRHRPVRHPWILGRRRRPGPRPGAPRRWICRPPRGRRLPVRRPSPRRGSTRRPLSPRRGKPRPPSPRQRPAGFSARRGLAGRQRSGRNPGQRTVCPLS